MKTNALNRHSPLILRTGRSLRNRVVIPPMASQTATADGCVTAETLEHYQRLALAKAGLLIVEYTYVHASGRSEENQLGIQGNAQIAGLSTLAQAIRESGVVPGIQLTHAGGKSERSLTGGILMSPSGIRVPVKDREPELPDPMTSPEIALWRESFVAAADRAVQAGFELVEFHAAHGYGLNQWLSPITNQRDDEYGGSLKNRSRLLLEIIGEIRARNPDLLLSVRMPGQDFSSNGLKVPDMQKLARALEAAGVDLLHVSSGIGGWRRPSDRRGEGYLVPEAEAIQSAVCIPVIGVGGIETGAYIDESLRISRFALAAVGRAILKDPAQWAEMNFNPKLQCLV